MGTRTESVIQYHEVVKPFRDNKVYRASVLANGLKVLLASCADLEKSAASMSVAVGSMNDPADLQGLAHLCEHMLFIESADQSKVSTRYTKFISENGGGCNAFTTRDQTNYHFDIASPSFTEALIRFSAFFTSTPAFPEQALQREINVVNLEHENKLTNEPWRKMAVESCTAKPNHPFGQFSTGNQDSLWNIPRNSGINVLERLRQFHSQHYSSTTMSLVVLSKESLDTLENLVVKLFSNVTNLGNSTCTWKENPYGEMECQIRIDIFPIADVRDLFVCFPIPDTRPYYKTFPHGYMSNLLGHKGPGSLFTFLSRKKWINNIYLNSSVPARGFGHFAIGLQLTVEGLNYVEEIVEYVFNYIKLLKDVGPQKYFWKELQKILEIQFRFQDQENSIDFVQRLSNLLHVYPISDVLSVGYILADYNESIITKFLDCLRPENCRILTIAKINENVVTTTEKWYGVKYNVSKLNPDLIQKWATSPTPDEMKLPPRNMFIPSNFDLKSSDKVGLVPTKILDDGLGKVWFFQDAELDIPKAFIRLELFSPLPMVDPMGLNLNEVTSMMIKESMVEELYGSILAGLNYSFKGTMYGIEITVDGYDEKISLLMELIIQRLINFKVDPRFYKWKRDWHESGLRNSTNQQPYIQVPYHLSLLMREKRFNNAELLESLKYMNIGMVQEYHTLLIAKANLEWLIYGNINESDALIFSSKWQNMFRHAGMVPLTNSQRFRLREVQLQKGTSFSYKHMLNNDTQKSCCAFLIQIGNRNLQENVLLEILDQLIYSPCFTQLRNNEQLGYIVRSSIRKSNGIQGLLIVVQGTVCPNIVHSRIDAFLENFESTIGSMPQEEFDKHKSAVMLKKNDNPKKLITRANRLWNNEIYTREYNFNRKKEELEFLKTVQMSDITSFYQKYIHPKSLKRKCIALYLESPNASNASRMTLNDGSPSSNNPIESIIEWKSQMLLSPLFIQNHEIQK